MDNERGYDAVTPIPYRIPIDQLIAIHAVTP